MSAAVRYGVEHMIVIAIEVPHVVAIDEIQLPFLATGHHQMWMTGDTRRIGQQDRRSGAEVRVRVVESLHIERNEIVRNLEAPAVDVLMSRPGGRVGHDLHKRLVVVAVRRKAARVECRSTAATVARLEIKGTAIRLEGQSTAPLPDARKAVVRRRVQHAAQHEAGGVQVGDVPLGHPTVIRSVVSVRSPLHIQRVVDEAQGSALMLAQRVELHDLLVRAVVGIGDGTVAVAVNIDRRAVAVVELRLADQIRRDPIGPVADFDGVQTLHIKVVAVDRLFGLRNEIDRAADGINDRSSRDPDFRIDVAATGVIAGNAGDAGRTQRVVGGHAGIEKAPLPENLPARRRGVDGIQAVVLRRDKDDVMQPGRSRASVRAIRDRDRRLDQRLGINLAVHRSRVQLAKRIHRHIRRSQQRLTGIQPGAGDVAVIGQHVGQHPTGLQHFHPLPIPVEVHSAATRTTSTLGNLTHERIEIAKQTLHDNDAPRESRNKWHRRTGFLRERQPTSRGIASEFCPRCGVTCNADSTLSHKSVARRSRMVARRSAS